MKYAIVTSDKNGPYVVGPFDSWDEANEYYVANGCYGSIFTLVTPPQKAVPEQTVMDTIDVDFVESFERDL
jgi:hypothetical protein